MSGNAVWGFEIVTTPSGRKIWPNDLKYEATRRTREDGASPGSIAAEIGAHECLVRKWWVADRRQRGEEVSVEGSAFAEVALAEARPAQSKPNQGTTAESTARILVDQVAIELPLSVAEHDLRKFIDAVRGVR